MEGKEGILNLGEAVRRHVYSSSSRSTATAHRRVRCSRVGMRNDLFVCTIIEQHSFRQLRAGEDHARSRQHPRVVPENQLEMSTKRREEEDDMNISIDNQIQLLAYLSKLLTLTHFIQAQRGINLVKLWLIHGRYVNRDYCYAYKTDCRTSGIDCPGPSSC
jgi:hypothetical protein